MIRLVRLCVLLVVLTVMATRLPFNPVLTAIAALSMIEIRLPDFLGILFASFCMDALSVLPLGFSLFPMLTMVVILQLLQSQIYVQSIASRISWAIAALLIFNLAWVGLLALRGETTHLVWSGVMWSMLRGSVEAIIAAFLAPLLNWYLTITWAELTKPQRIVVH